MKTRNTLEMTRYFLNRLQETEGKTEHQYYLYAFTVGWRTIFDALLSDLADYYGLTDEIYRLSRIFRWAGMNTKSFFLAAHQRALDCGDGQIEETANWLSEKFREMKKLRISADRN